MRHAIGGARVGFVEDIAHAQGKAGPRHQLPPHAYVRQGIGGDGAAVGGVLKPPTDMADAAVGDPAPGEFPTHKGVGAVCRHIGRAIASAIEQRAAYRFIKVVVTRAQQGGVQRDAQPVQRLQRQRCFDASGRLLAHLHLQRRDQRIGCQQLSLDDIIDGQGPLAARSPEDMLDPGLILATGRQVEAALDGAGGHQGADRVGGGCILRVKGQGRHGIIDRPGAPCDRIGGRGEIVGRGHMIGLGDFRTVVADPAHQ